MGLSNAALQKLKKDTEEKVYKLRKALYGNIESLVQQDRSIFCAKWF